MADFDGTSPRKQAQRYTLADWRTWPEGERWELIDGQAWAMSPSPRVSHQKAAGGLYHALCLFLEGKPCIPLIAPLDVFLQDGEETVVEPDVMVVCREDIIQDDGIHGAPDFIAEVLSDSTAYKDLGAKKQAYARAGVREYWVIHPLARTVTTWQLKGTDYAPGQDHPAGTPASSAVLPGFTWVCP